MAKLRGPTEAQQMRVRQMLATGMLPRKLEGAFSVPSAGAADDDREASRSSP